MADRFLFKKFASETNDVGQFGSFQSTGGNIGDGVKTTDPDLIQSLPAWKAGWGNAVDNGLLLPRLEEMNGVQRVFAEMLWNQWRDGITFWQAGAPVKALQSVVMYQTGDEFPKLYINKTGVNGTNPPPQDTDNWKPLSDFFVTTDTVQTITASKNLKTGGTNGYSRPFQIFMPTSTESNPTEEKTREIAFLSSDGTGNNYEGSLIHSRSTTGESYTGLRAGRLVNGTYKEGALGVRTTADGTTFGIAPTPSIGATGNEITTAGWFNTKMQVVSALPANPDPNVFYFIPE